ncbi:putative T7SS-secreted protein [Streptomyces luteireticuli]|uniref:Type IV secretion protein Rhs n=1 Tax=Streptomyces luteireticuli TaxID=173858 RepID=A0ABN0YWX9_9ACTN
MDFSIGGIKRGLKKGVDKVGDATEDLIDEGEKQLGKGINYAAHKVGDGLDKVGLHDMADMADDFGDHMASRLGAHVNEKQLGETEDPKDLVHGSTSRIQSATSHLTDFSSAFGRVGRGMSNLDSEHWKGKGADAFREKFAMHPKQWLQAQQACEEAAKALKAYEHTVHWAQGKAKEAIATYKAGKEAQKKAFDTYKAQVDSYNDAAKTYNAKLDKGEDPGTRPTPPGSCPNAGADKIQAAQEMLTEARKQRNSAAETAASALRNALRNAPKKPEFTDRMGMNLDDFQQAGAVEVTHVAGGVFKGAADTVKFARTIIPIDPYNVTHPALYLDHMTNLGAGFVTLANHPDQIPSTLLGTGWGKDPSEAAGRLGFDALTALATGGTSAGGAAARRVAMNAARKGMEEAAEGAAESTARKAAKELADEPKTHPEKVETGGTDPVDVTTGRMFLPQTDVSLPGALPLVFSRHVKSGYRCGRWFGPSWASTVDQRLEIDTEGVIFVDEHGRLLEYPHPAPGVPTLPVQGPRWPLDLSSDGTYTIHIPEAGHTRHFASYGSYGAEGIRLLEEITDRNGHRTAFDYDADGTPTGITHHSGRRIRVTTHAGRITALHLADTELIRYGYTDGNLTEVYNSSGRPLRFAYDERGRVTSWTDRNHTHYQYVYDDQDRCVFESGAEGHMRCALEYGAPDPATGLRVTRVTDSLGNTSTYTINSRSQIVAQTDPTGATTLSAWDRHDRLLSRTDPLGRTTEYTYDADGRLTTVTRPDGLTLAATLNELGLPETTTGPDGTVWRHTYDDAGNRTSTTDPTGATTSYTYDATGHLVSLTDALGNTTRVTCDAAGLPIKTIDPLGGVTTSHRDAFGRVVAVTDPLGSTTRLAWTVEGQLAHRIAPDGAEEHWTYDGEGNCTTYTDALGAETHYEYGPFDQLTAKTGPDGVRYEFAHDTSLRLRRVTNPQGLTWDYDYDPAGRLTSETDFDGRTLTYAHDAAGRLTSRTNGLGDTVSYAYDALDRLVTKTAGDAVTTYAHDATGHLLQATGPDATLVYSRDRLGRVKSETTNGRTLTHAYDRLSRRVRRITPAGALTTWAYDAAGNCTSLTASGHTFAMEHDAAGREIARHFGEDLTLAHHWDPAGRLQSQSLTSGPTPLHHRTYTYRPDGHLTGIADSTTGTRTFDLDAAGRVTAVHAHGWTERYAYDAAGNQTAATWPTDHPGTESQGPRAYTGTRITRAGNVRYEHDAQGRVTLRQKTRLSRKPDTWRYEWNAEDQLTTVVTPDGTRWGYLYDPLGRRIAKQRLTAADEIAEQVDFTWDGPTLTEQTTTASTLPNPVTLTWDHDGLHPISQTERISAADASQREIDRRFFAIITDLVGTPTELIDETGTTAWRTRTTLWGTTAWATDSTAYTPLRFPGQYFDPETGLHYNFHRHYDPEIARYTSSDPLGLAPTPNPTAYVPNPHTVADPYGLSPYPLGEKSNPFPSRTDAEKVAHELAGITQDSELLAEWTVTGDIRMKHMEGYVYSPEPSHWGNFRQYETPQGSRVVVEHTHDPAGPHFHAGKPKGDDDRTWVNFGWDNSNYKEMERYAKINKPGGDHHLFYK